MIGFEGHARIAEADMSATQGNLVAGWRKQVEAHIWPYTLEGQILRQVLGVFRLVALQIPFQVLAKIGGAHGHGLHHFIQPSLSNKAIHARCHQGPDNKLSRRFASPEIKINRGHYNTCYTLNPNLKKIAPNYLFY